MPCGSPFNRAQLQASLALFAVLALACNSTTTKADSGIDSGPEWLHVCDTVGAACTGDGDCCTNLTCQSGSCQPSASTCAGYLEACGASVGCCEPPTGSGAALLICSTLNDAGLSLCLSPSGGSSCGSDSDCPSPYLCTQGACGLSSDGQDCNTKTAGTCVPGDICVGSQSEYNKLTSGGAAVDPCLKSGYVCVLFNSASGVIGLCVTPGVLPQQYWSPSGDPYDNSICNPADNKCESSYIGADQSAPVCGTFFLSGDNHCYEGCTNGDQCDSIAFDCVQGSCKPNYCYADGHNRQNDAGWAGYLTPFQTQNGGIAISDDPHVLFNLCPLDAGFPTACLPQYDQMLGVATGECVRVGGSGSGGWGDPCDPNPYRNNLNGLCGFGTYCNLGTCMPWCDVGSHDLVQCPAGTACQTLPTGPLTSTATGTNHAIGVCAEPCDPYLDATQNDCQPFGTDGGQATLGCKLSGNGSDSSPSPGNCVALVDAPIAVGDPCPPFQWLDPCVSGAQCLQVADAGVNFVCRQMCDPIPADNAVPSVACPDGQSCVQFASCPSGVCSHEGDCE